MKTTTITWTGRYLLVGDRGVTTRRTTEYYLPLVGKVSIGCDQRNSIVLERPGVQNQHCTLFVTGGAVFVHVDDSEADTRVNGSRVRGDELLYDSDCLTVGSVDFKLALLRPTIRAGLGKSVAGQHVTRLVFESEFASRDEPSEPPTVVSGARRATELPSVGDQDDNPTPAHRPCVECLDDVVGSRCDNCGAPLIVGGYRVTRLVHHGEFRNLYLAEHRDTGDRCYALKEIRFASVPGAKQLDAFEREGQILRQLNHPNIPRFVSSFRDGQGLGLRVYLAQEFVKGKPVSALREGCFDVTSAADIAHKVLPILDYLHGLALPVVH